MSQDTSPSASATGSPAPIAEVSRYRNLPPIGQTILMVSAVGSVLASIYIIFGIGNLVKANSPFSPYIPLETEYFYFMLALLLPLAFLIYPLRLRDADRIPFYDWLLAAVTFAICTYFTISGSEILDVGWEYDSPQHAKYMSYVLWALVLEATRRAGGNAIFAVCLLVSIYPMFANYAPGFMKGDPVSPQITAGFHIFGTESMLGIPMNAFANLVVGFLIFGVALQYSGGGAFFLNLAFALLGKKRGGPAKVAIFGSGLMGSMSGSVITNVLTTGVMTIPAMKRVGFKSSTAGAVEACASTGGVLMPPVMGATAFVMATFLELPYSAIIIAAAFPSALYYLGLYLQIDAYAARHGLKGLPADEVPPILKVLKDGWYFVFVFMMLIVMLLYMQREAQAPYYATALLLFINQIAKAHRWNWSRFVEFIRGIGILFAELAALLAGVGLIIGALTLTGKVGTLAYELVNIAGSNAFFLLLMGALASFILGMGMTVTAAYLFLAVTIAPALTQAGMDKLAVHLFLMYWGMISFITPPVAIGAYAASTIAKSNPMETGFEAMRLGSIIYFVPFFFVLNPALIGNGTTAEVLLVLTSTAIGIWLISAGLQGYLSGVGALDGNGLTWLARALLVVGGFTLALPGNNPIVGYSHLQINAAAAIIISLGVATAFVSRRRVLA